MGCGAELRKMLEPLGVYSFEGYSGGAINALGSSLDQAEAALTGQKENLFLETAGERGLSALEALFPMLPGKDLENRRAALTVLLGENEGGFTRDGIIRTLGACSIPVTITEQSGLRILVTLEGEVTMEEDPVFLMWVLEQVLPCHLGVTCAYQYTAWDTGKLTQAQAALGTLRQRTRAEWEELLGAIA